MKYDPNVWFSLRFGVYLLWRLREKYGENVINSNKYQKERESWIVAVTLLGISKITNETWWIQVPLEDPPDMLAMKLTPDEDERWNYLNYRKVEVMEITKHSSGDIVNAILTKLKGKSYEKETGLIVYLRRDMNINDMRQLSEQIKDKIKTVSDIWLVGNTKPNTNDFIAFSIFPDVEVIRYNLDEELAKIMPGDTINVSRKKGTQAELIKGEFQVVFNPHRKKA